MPLLYPTHSTLHTAFAAQTPNAQFGKEPRSSRTTLSKAPAGRFTAWSAADDVKSKASALSNEAQKEIAKASSAAQAKTGQIELYSLKYYAACTFGGLLACVSKVHPRWIGSG